MSLSWQFSEDGILSKLWAEKCLIIASLILIFTSNDSANLRNFKKTENFQKISFLNLITVNILKKSEYWLNIQPVSVSVSRRVMQCSKACKITACVTGLPMNMIFIHDKIIERQGGKKFLSDK